MTEVTGRDSYIITEALAFAYAAMRYVPRLNRPESDRYDMRALLFARVGRHSAEFLLGQAMLHAWHLTHDIPAAGRTGEDLRDTLHRIREQVVQEPSDPDITLLVQHIDRCLAAVADG